jgi:MGT family glycosyltransferase
VTKALFFSLPLTGHINPSLGLVRELVRRGDEVVYYATDAYARKIEESGARYCPYQNAFLADMRQLPEQLHEMSWLLMRTTAEVLERQMDDFRAQRPNYVITDSVAPWGFWVAEILGVPLVTSVSTFAFNRHVLAFAASRGVRPKSARHFLSKIRHVAKALTLGRRLRSCYKVRGPGVKGLMVVRSDLNIVYTSRYFQPCAQTFDQHFQFVGPSIANVGEPPGFPWDELRHPVVVYVSLGTLFNADASFYRSCFEAFRDEDFQVVMSLGTSLSSESLGPAPSNFIVRTHVPQWEVLRRTTIFVTHGGMNSVSESLFCGVPVVVVPQMGEQEMVGRRAEDLGAGLVIAKNEVTPEKLRGSVRRLLTGLENGQPEMRPDFNMSSFFELAP